MCFSLYLWRLSAADAGRPSQARLRPQARVSESTPGPQPLWCYPPPRRLGAARHAFLRCRWVHQLSDWSVAASHIQQQSVLLCRASVWWMSEISKPDRMISTRVTIRDISHLSLGWSCWVNLWLPVSVLGHCRSSTVHSYCAMLGSCIWNVHV